MIGVQAKEGVLLGSLDGLGAAVVLDEKAILDPAAGEVCDETGQIEVGAEARKCEMTIRSVEAAGSPEKRISSMAKGAASWSSEPLLWVFPNPRAPRRRERARRPDRDRLETA